MILLCNGPWYTLIGIDGVAPKRCIIFVSHGQFRVGRMWRQIVLIWEMHNPFGTAGEALGSDTQLPRLTLVPVKVTAVAVSDGDHFAWLKTLFLRGYENWDKVG